jgi:hypothetical protein
MLMALLVETKLNNKKERERKRERETDSVCFLSFPLPFSLRRRFVRGDCAIGHSCLSVYALGKEKERCRDMMR